MNARSPTRGILILKALALFLGLGLCWAGSAFANPFEETVRILEERTSFHWGRDCFVWIVHYTEDLVDPWVDAEAGRMGMSESERQAYHKNFVEELKIGSAEPFLFSIYSFGARPVQFSPLSEKMALVTADGERIKPLRYDSRLDQPLSGLVQGLVFFPKQKHGDFAVSVRGMGVYDERLFAFGVPAVAETAVVDVVEEEEIPIVVVDLPPVKEKEPPAKKSVRPVVIRPPKVEVVEEEQSPQPSVRPPGPPASGDSDMADFVEAIRAGREAEFDSADVGADSAYVSREKTLKTFLGLWAEQRFEQMYPMLSEASKKLFTPAMFVAEVKKAADFRAAIKDGYKIEWMGDDRAKIVAVRRLLMIRSLVGRTLGVVRENSSWKIVW